MTKALTEYTSKDFLNDERFIKWVKYQDASLGDFWNGWLSTLPSNIIEYENAVLELRLMLSVSPILIKQDKLDAIFIKIDAEVFNIIPLKTLKHSYLRYAAAILVPLLLFSVLYLTLKKDSHFFEQNVKIVDHKKATLMLSDGRTIVLGSDEKSLVDASGARIEKDSNGIRYADQNIKTAIAYNTIYVPRGAEYKLVLSDGTQIWLNSETKLRYPVKVMQEGNRNVYLENGEAYFQVTKNKHSPFLVNLNGMQVEVLGTSFNINTFNEKIVTTLEEGSVEINRANSSAVLLKPGEQTVYGLSSKKLTKNEVDTYPYTSWRSGWLVFNDDSLEEVMEQVGRWYNLDVEYASEDIKNIRFGGKLKKSKSVQDILKVILQSNDIEAFVSDGKITISPKK